MRIQDIANLGRMLGQFLARFQDCFARPAGRTLLAVYVRGLLSDMQRKNAEAIALGQEIGRTMGMRLMMISLWALASS